MVEDRRVSRENDEYQKEKYHLYLMREIDPDCEYIYGNLCFTLADMPYKRNTTREQGLSISRLREQFFSQSWPQFWPASCFELICALTFALSEESGMSNWWCFTQILANIGLFDATNGQNWKGGQKWISQFWPLFDRISGPEGVFLVFPTQKKLKNPTFLEQIELYSAEID